MSNILDQEKKELYGLFDTKTLNLHSKPFDHIHTRQIFIERAAMHSDIVIDFSDNLPESEECFFFDPFSKRLVIDAKISVSKLPKLIIAINTFTFGKQNNKHYTATKEMENHIKAII
jgi:hypothetical protein